MQRHSAITGNTAQFLTTVPFDKVFHEGGLAGDTTIIGHRCAEVLASSPLPLSRCLQWIYCRSEAERDTLLHSLGELADLWRKQIRVSDDIRVFNRMFVYVENVKLSQTGVLVELHPRTDGRNIHFRLEAKNYEGRIVAQFINPDFEPIPSGAKRWRVPCKLMPGLYEVSIWVENELAYKARLALGDDLV
jgi:hypothetical protein